MEERVNLVDAASGCQPHKTNKQIRTELKVNKDAERDESSTRLISGVRIQQRDKSSTGAAIALQHKKANENKRKTKAAGGQKIQ